MALKLRLRRMGKKKQPIYKIVAADSRSPRDGKFIEAVGLYNPLTKPHTITLREDRVMYWLGVGAQPTNTVNSLLSQTGINLKRELTKKGLSEDQMQVEVQKWADAKEAKGKKTGEKKSKKAEAAEKAKLEAEEKAKADAEKAKVEAAEKAKAEAEAAEKTKAEELKTESTSEGTGAASEEKPAE